ncbi:MAG: methyltransferase [Kiritimatiellia bacterium]|nr:methyltransferase [Kiritimatiellia bacterium]
MKLVQRHGPRSVEVMGRTYVVSPEVFNPKFFITSKFMAEHVSVGAEDEVLDIGTGSGIQAITAGQVARKVVATDINRQAVRCARDNVKQHGLDNTISVLEGDLFSPLPAGLMFTVILFTPPYLEGTLRSNLDHALYDPHKSLAKRFFMGAKPHLKPEGYVQMIYSSIADPASVLRMAGQLGWDNHVLAEKKTLLETFRIYRLTLRRGQADSGA